MERREGKEVPRHSARTATPLPDQQGFPLSPFDVLERACMLSLKPEFGAARAIVPSAPNTPQPLAQKRNAGLLTCTILSSAASNPFVRRGAKKKPCIWAPHLIAARLPRDIAGAAVNNERILSHSFVQSIKDRNNDGSECSAFAEERRAAGGNPLRGRTRRRAPAGVKKPGAKNDHVIGPGEATRTLHQQRRQGLTTRAGRHLGRRRGSKRHRLKRRQDRNNDGSECSAFAEERRAAGGNPLRGRTRRRAPAGVKKPGAKNDHVIGPGEATRTLHQQRRQGLTTRAGRHLGRRRGSKRHRLKR
ncbi:hypothetical protein HPB50_020557 [Hyalomma asiaticum]|uniref:Uncharacterized protein n=1 Tax=Hyalomma asiaticum TaxID=266040 RepID=A0ACB7TL86_HYAAI|nr:hypothetical protein HPB50_020557 [Hyalomma asiaticum]